MKKITKEILTYMIMLLLSIILIIIGVIYDGNIGAILLNIGLSIVSTVIIYFILTICVGNPMDPVVVKFDQLSEELSKSTSLLRSSKETGVINVWNTRSDCPIIEWLDGIGNSEGDVRILCYAMSFLSDDSHFEDIMKKKAYEGANIKILLGAPKGNCIISRTKEEKNEGDISERINRTVLRIEAINKELEDGKKIELRFHDTPLYSSIYMFGTKAIITPQLYATRGALAPTIEVEKTDNRKCMYNQYSKMFDEIWINGSTGIDG